MSRASLFLPLALLVLAAGLALGLVRPATPSPTRSPTLAPASASPASALPAVTPSATPPARGVGGPPIVEYPLPTTVHPEALTSSPDGALWFVARDAYRGDRLGRITLDGQLTEYPLPADSHPSDLVADADGGLWFGNGPRLTRLAPNGDIRDVPLASRASLVQSLARAGDGALWFTILTKDGADGGVGRVSIGRLTAPGELAETPLPTAARDGGAVLNGAVTAGADGSAWFSARGGSHIGRLTVEGVLTEYPLPDRTRVGAMTAAGDGGVWFVAQAVEPRLARLAADGGITSFPLPLRAPSIAALAAGPDGAVWFTAQAGSAGGGDKLGRVAPNGAVRLWPLPTWQGGPLDLTFGPDGALWFTESVAHQIGRADPAALLAIPAGGEAAAIPTLTMTPVPPTVLPPLPPQAALAYWDGAAVWLVEGSRGRRQVAAADRLDSLLISPNRQWVAYTQRTPDGRALEVWAVRWDGTGGRRLLADADLPLDDLPADLRDRGVTRGVSLVGWAPDGRRLVFTTLAVWPGGQRFPVQPPFFGLRPAYDLWSVDPASGEIRRLLPYGQGGVFVFSPDGARVALLQETSLAVADADGAHRRVLLTYQSEAGALGMAHPPLYPVVPPAARLWSPDGQSLRLAVFETPDTHGRCPRQAVFRLPLDAPAEWLGCEGETPLPEASPDGRWLGYSHAVGGVAEVVIANADGSNPQVVAPGVFAGWLPDSQGFLYRQGERQNERLYLGTPGGPPRLLGPARDWPAGRWLSGDLLVYYHHELGTIAEVGELRWRTLDGREGAFARVENREIPSGPWLLFDVASNGP